MSDSDDQIAEQAAAQEERRAAEESLIAQRNAAQRAADEEAGEAREHPLILDGEGDATAAKGFPADQQSTEDREQR